MSELDSFQRFSDQLQRGYRDGAARVVFSRYVDRLVALARSRLDRQIRQKEDPEDVVQSVFRSFFAHQDAGEFRLTGWDSLWALLAMLAVRKCARRRERWRSKKRAVDREIQVGAACSVSASEWDIIGAEPLPEDAAVLAETLELLLQPLDPRTGHRRFFWSNRHRGT